jgi:hypothetical protein
MARMKEHLRGQPYLTLLLDPRQHVREWVALQPRLVGSYKTEVRSILVPSLCILLGSVT